MVEPEALIAKAYHGAVGGEARARRQCPNHPTIAYHGEVGGEAAKPEFGFLLWRSMIISLTMP